MVYGKDRHEEGYAEAVAQATPGNGDFVAASRTAVPALVEALRASLAWFGDRGNHDEDCGWTTFGDIDEDCDCPLHELYSAIASGLGVRS